MKQLPHPKPTVQSDVASEAQHLHQSGRTVNGNMVAGGGGTVILDLTSGSSAFLAQHGATPSGNDRSPVDISPWSRFIASK
jgi:hypothetical protein